MTPPAGFWPMLLAPVVAALLAVSTGPALRWLDRHPMGLDPQDPPPAYADLAGPRFVGTVSVLCLLAAVIVVWRAPPVTWAVWLPLASVGVLLAAIDGRTTWLPLRLTRVLWALVAVGALAAWPLAGPGVLLTAGLGAMAHTLFWWLVWRVTGAIGFGDVRLAPALGAAATMVSLPLGFWALLCGTLLGAAHGVLRTVRGRRGEFAYGPSLVAGCFLALLIRP